MDRQKGSTSRLPVRRKSLHEWYSHVAFTRLMPGAAIINVQTCWHEDDLAGRQLREHPHEWHVLRLPAIAEENDALGREPGTALWPDRYPLDVLQKIRTVIGTAAFVSLYQQRPSAARGNVFVRSWWRTYAEPPADIKRIVISVDTAFKVGEENDWSVATIWGAAPNGFYLLHMWRERVEFPKLKHMIVTLATEWKANVVW
jgi:hypothetical protein